MKEMNLAALVNRVGSLYEGPNSPSRIVPMEGIRGLAVALVFFVHFHALFRTYLSDHSVLFALSEYMGIIGHAGVDLFFVLSGYLIYGIILRRPVGYFKFVRRRAERIYPAFLAVFVIYIVLSYLFPEKSRIPGDFKDAVAYLTTNVLLLPGMVDVRPMITVAWSLSYEFFFYLLLPLFVLIARVRAWSQKSRVLAFVGIYLIYLAYSFLMPYSRVRLLMFVTGILLYELVQSTSRVRDGMARREKTAVLLLVLVLGFTYVLHKWTVWFAGIPGLTSGQTVTAGVPVNQGPYRVLLLSIGCFLFVLAAIAYEGFLSRWLSWSPLRYLGNMSYSYYLIHGLALQGVMLIAYRLVPPVGHSPLLFSGLLLAGFLATWIASTALYLAVEKPLSFARVSRSRGRGQ